MQASLHAFFLLSLAVLASCASDLQMAAKDLGEIDHDEGRVFGSIAVLVAPPELEAARERSGGLLTLTGVGGLFAADAAKVDFKVTFRRASRSFGRSLELRSGAPQAYAARLEQGEYGIHVTCSQMPGDELTLTSTVLLGAGETLYLGRLLLLVPSSVGEPGTSFLLDTRVELHEIDDLALLGDEYRAVLPGPMERPPR